MEALKRFSMGLIALKQLLRLETLNGHLLQLVNTALLGLIAPLDASKALF